MKLLLLTCLFAILSGCASIEDIRSLRIIVTDLQNGTITRTEFNTRVDAVADEAEERADKIAELAGQGLTIAESVGGAGGITGLGMLALGLYRNHTRRKNGIVQQPTA